MWGPAALFNEENPFSFAPSLITIAPPYWVFMTRIVPSTMNVGFFKIFTNCYEVYIAISVTRLEEVK